MRVFYWTLPIGSDPRRLYQVMTEQGICMEVPLNNIGPTMLQAMLEDGFTEISCDTAYKIGFPT